jgi:hypothetical protein
LPIALELGLHRRIVGKWIRLEALPERNRMTPKDSTVLWGRSKDPRALPMLEGADKVQATQLANAYLSSLAKQVEAVQAIEAGHIVERAHEIQVREERESTDAAEKARVLRATAYEAERNLGPDTPPGDTRAVDAQALEMAALRAERTAARERSEADAMSREEQAFRSNRIAPAPANPNLPRAGEKLREEQELLIDRIETQRMSHTRVHRR